jgi:antirestriction protein ArdC
MEVIMSNRAAPAAFSELLQKAVSEPGLISSAYTQFHHFSLGNMLLAAFQCTTRGLAFGPLATYPRWQELGRQVRKGERAIVLCQPVVVPREARDQRAQGATGTERVPVDSNPIVRFTYRANWFVLAQTDGADLSPAALPGWDRTRALDALTVVEVPYSSIDGNVMGYARKREIAISPINPLPHKTLFHELAHVLLGHTAEIEQTDSEVTPRNLREAEAEAVALLCCEALNLPGTEFCRGYIQNWLGAGNPIPERSAQRILRAADQILRAGRPEAEHDEEGRP